MRLRGSLANSYLNYGVSTEVKSLFWIEELQLEVNRPSRGFGQDSIQESGWEHKHWAGLSIPLLVPWPLFGGLTWVLCIRSHCCEVQLPLGLGWRRGTQGGRWDWIHSPVNTNQRFWSHQTAPSAIFQPFCKSQEPREMKRWEHIID